MGSFSEEMEEKQRRRDDNNHLQRSRITQKKAVWRQKSLFSVWNRVLNTCRQTRRANGRMSRADCAKRMMDNVSVSSATRGRSTTFTSTMCLPWDWLTLALAWVFSATTLHFKGFFWSRVPLAWRDRNNLKVLDVGRLGAVLFLSDKSTAHS